MTTAGSRQHISIVVEAQDRASRKVKSIGDSIRKNLGGSMRSAALSMISFTSILSAVGLSITGVTVILKKWFGDIQKANRAVALMGVQLRVAGFSTDRANASIERFRDNLSRAALQALPGMDEQLKVMLATMGEGSLKEMDTYAKKLDDVTDIKFEDAFRALAEAQAGNVKTMNDLGIAGDDYAEILKNIDEIEKEVLENETALEKMWRNIQDAFSEAVDNMIESANRLLGDEGIPGIILGMIDLIGEMTGVTGLGEKMRKNIEDSIDFVVAFFTSEEGQQSRFSEMGQNFATQIVMGLFGWLIGDTAIELVELAWQGNWNGVWALLKKEAPGWGKDLAFKAGEGFLNYILGPLMDLSLTAWEFMGSAMESLWNDAKNWGWDLGASIGNGLIGAIEWAINQAVGFINDFLAEAESLLNSVPGVNVDLGRVGGISIPRIPPREGTANILPQATPVTATQSAPLILNVNGREFARATIEVMDGQMRLRQPGLGIN